MSGETPESISELYNTVSEDAVSGVVNGLVNRLLSLDEDFHKIGSDHVDRVFKERDDAKMGQSPAKTFMHNMASFFGLEDLQRAVILGKPKKLSKIIWKETHSDQERNDDTRGTIFFENLEQFRALRKEVTLDGSLITRYLPLIAEEDKDKRKENKQRLGINFCKWHKPSGTAKAITFKEGSFDDRVAIPSKYGAAGQVQFSLMITHKKSTKATPFEIMIRHIGEDQAHQASHHLYDLLRMMDESSGKKMSEVERAVKEGLVTANAALYDTAGYETGTLFLRAVPPTRITREQAEHAHSVLDSFLSTLRPELSYKAKKLLNRVVRETYEDTDERRGFIEFIKTERASNIPIIQEAIESSGLDESDKKYLRRALNKQKNAWEKNADIIDAFKKAKHAVSQKLYQMDHMLRDYRKHSDPAFRIEPPVKKGNNPELDQLP